MRRSSSPYTLAALSLVCILVLAACCSTSTPVLRYITISPASQSTTVGTQVTFTATAYYSDGSQAPASSLVAWGSSNTSVATVSGGVCNPLTAGTTTITATAAGTPGASATLTVTNAAPITLVSIAVTPASPTVGVGGSQQFDAVGTYSDGSTNDVTTTATWSSSNTAAATIGAATGLATVPTTATSLATSTIAAALNGITGTATLTVGGASLQIVATPNVSKIAIGNSVTLLAQEVYTDSSIHPPANVVIWTNTPTPAGAAGFLALTSSTNSDTSVVSGLAAGSTVITATDGTLTANVTITVVTGSTQFAYVSNSGDSPADIGSFTVTAGTSPYLTSLGTFDVPSPSTQIAINPSGQSLYFVDGIANVNAASIATNGSLTTLGSPQSAGAATTFAFAAIDPFGRFLFVSNDVQGTTGAIYTYVLNPDGSIPASSSSIGTNLDAPQCVIVDRTGSYVFATNLNADNVSSYSITQSGSSAGALTALSTASTGKGPVLATLDPTGTHLFVADSVDNTIAAFTIGSGGSLTAIGSAPFALTGTTASTSIFNLVVDPSGTHIYALDSSGFVWGFNLGSGGVIGSAIAGSPFALAGTAPAPLGGIVIDPADKILAVDDNANNLIDVFPIGTGGALGTPVTVNTGAAPLYVTFLNAP